MSQEITTLSLSKPITSEDGFHHLVYSISGTTHTLFLDNSAIVMNISGGNVFSTYPDIRNLFCGIAGDLSYGYTGYIDDFKVYNRALGSTDVSAIYNSVSINKQLIASAVGASVVPISVLSKSYVAFTSTTGTNTISFNQSVTANVFIIGGGGAGEGPHGGAGGAGAYYNGTFTFNANTTYTINVGAGGVYAGLGATGGNGGNTTITTGGVTQLIVNGGGGGVSTTTNGVNGGCGGGAGGVNSGAYSGGSAVNTGTNGTGFAGGAKGGNYAGGGGGGAGGIGQNANGVSGGNGGNAIVVDLTGTAKAYGGGGGGGSWDNAGGATSVGGGVSINGVMTYVGGNPNTCFNGSTINAGTPPVANTGSGGGGGGAFSAYGTNGSAGIAIIQWTSTSTSASDYIGPIDKLSSSAKISMLYSGTGATLSAGAYGIILLYSKYTGPSIQIKNGSSGTPTDFYPALDGSTTLKTASGTTLTSFLAGEIAYVTKWYDQTGNGKHATAQGSPLPFLNTTTFVVDFGTSGFFSLSDGSFPYGNASYSYVYKQGRLVSNFTVYSGGNWGVFGQNGALLCTPTYNDAWYAYDFYGMTPVANSVVAATYGGAGNNTGVGGKKFYINNTLQTPTGVDGRTGPSGLIRGQTAQNCFLGACHPSARTAYFNYQSTMPYFYWLPYQLGTSDISILGPI